MENSARQSRNYRHCGVPCCGTCRWFTRVYEETFCEHPKNVVDVVKDEYVSQPTDDMVCGWFEKKEDNNA